MVQLVIITLLVLVFMVLVGFMLGDAILCWRIFWREMNGENVADMPDPLDCTASAGLCALAAAIGLLVLHQAGL